MTSREREGAEKEQRRHSTLHLYPIARGVSNIKTSKHQNGSARRHTGARKIPKITFHPSHLNFLRSKSSCHSTAPAFLQAYPPKYPTAPAFCKHTIHNPDRAAFCKHIPTIPFPTTAGPRRGQRWAWGHGKKNIVSHQGHGPIVGKKKQSAQKKVVDTKTDADRAQKERQTDKEGDGHMRERERRRQTANPATTKKKKRTDLGSTGLETGPP